MILIFVGDLIQENHHTFMYGGTTIYLARLKLQLNIIHLIVLNASIWVLPVLNLTKIGKLHRILILKNLIYVGDLILGSLHTFILGVISM
ncbi:MAG: hypothetical protein EBR82_86290 [Caulobacteraceae bacterium]|nr:hypothetical protein [Caulobacteraceae bacterium]